MAEQSQPDVVAVSFINAAVAPKSESVGVFIEGKELDPFMLKFSQSDARKLVTGVLDALKVLINVSPPTKAGERATIVEKWEVGKAFPDRVWLIFQSLAYDRHSYSVRPIDARAIAKRLVEMADQVEQEISSDPKH